MSYNNLSLKRDIIDDLESMSSITESHDREFLNLLCRQFFSDEKLVGLRVTNKTTGSKDIATVPMSPNRKSLMNGTYCIY